MRSIALTQNQSWLGDAWRVVYVGDDGESQSSVLRRAKRNIEIWHRATTTTREEADTDIAGETARLIILTEDEALAQYAPELSIWLDNVSVLYGAGARYNWLAARLEEAHGRSAERAADAARST